VRPEHFDAFRPVCPVCRGGQLLSPLQIAQVLRREGEHIVEGILHCSTETCRREFPIVDGIPILVADLRRYVAENITEIRASNDLSADVESLLGDCCGPGSAWDRTRQYLSSYGWDHYGDLDPDQLNEQVQPGSVLRLLTAALRLLDDRPDGLILDVGCSVGRSTFALAERHKTLVLGIDISFPMLQLAAHVLRQEQVSYARRRVGIVYDRRVFPARMPAADRVDFWVCDALALPLPPRSVDLAMCLNILDCVVSPVQLLASLQYVLHSGGQTVLACPYDWSPVATPVESWLGGHSQRSPSAGASEAVLRALLDSVLDPDWPHRLRITGETPGVPWNLRVHQRSNMAYQAHLLAARAES
jgi:SAM-dependent methyltransferase/uncharacterized protein YbaR (Trm112 family)